MPTPPKLPNGNTIKERIGVFGLPKIGKTHLYFTIAKWHHDLGSDAKFYGINTDESWQVLYMNEEFCNLPNIIWDDEISTFQQMLDATKRYHSVMRPQDWLCLDLLDDGWNYVQDEYAHMSAKEEGKDFDNLGDLWVEGSTKEYPIKGWDWGTPNARYRILANNYILRGPGHRMVISGQTNVTEPSANMKEDETIRKTREAFAHLGVKPTGQKQDPFRWHTILHVTSRGPKQQSLTTAGERWGNRRWWGRTMSNGMAKPEKMDDFFLDYLVGTAGWSMD